MAILDRIATVIRSNLNALINQAEEPNGMKFRCKLRGCKALI
jgi:phage shock protein A